MYSAPRFTLKDFVWWHAFPFIHPFRSFASQVDFASMLLLSLWSWYLCRHRSLVICWLLLTRLELQAESNTRRKVSLQILHCPYHQKQSYSDATISLMNLAHLFSQISSARVFCFLLSDEYYVSDEMSVNLPGCDMHITWRLCLASCPRLKRLVISLATIAWRVQIRDTNDVVTQKTLPDSSQTIAQDFRISLGRPKTEPRERYYWVGLGVGA